MRGSSPRMTREKSGNAHINKSISGGINGMSAGGIG
jgi:hypothetical protein